MNSSSLKQKAVMAALGVVLAYALVAVMWFMNLDRKMGWCPKSWGDAMRSYEKACKTYKDECKLIGQRQKWIEAYENERNKMKSFKGDEATDTIWLEKLDEFAAKHHMSLTGEVSPGKEIKAGEVLELQLDVKSWEGALESLVKFLYELENTDDGMFDISQISIRPIASKKGYLKGTMTVTCAYMRGE